MKNIDILLSKIEGLPEIKIKEVEDFVDFLKHKDAEKSTLKSVSLASEKAFLDVWDNDEDSIYDGV